MCNVSLIILLTVGDEDSFKQHQERSDDFVVLGKVSKRHGADEGIVPGRNRFLEIK